MLFGIDGNGIKAAPAKRMASEYAHKRKSEAFYKAPLRKSLQRILRAGRFKPAARRLKRGNESPVCFDYQDAQCFH